MLGLFKGAEKNVKCNSTGAGIENLNLRTTPDHRQQSENNDVSTGYLVGNQGPITTVTKKM
jgi:hypothetical protein